MNTFCKVIGTIPTASAVLFAALSGFAETGKSTNAASADASAFSSHATPTGTSGAHSPAARARRAWFEDARFGMFIHWGPYSAYEGSWRGHTLPDPDPSLPSGNSWYAEWIQTRFGIPKAEYEATAKSFNPVKFDAEALVLEAKRAGMKYIAITSKHHDGFALWDSKVSDYDLGSTPCMRDILGELAAACRKHDIKLGFYYSHWQDWEAPGGAIPPWPKNIQPTDEQFEKYWQGKCLPQIAELIERYDPDLFWFDTWGDSGEEKITEKRRDELIGLIRSKIPKCLINGRIAFSNPGNDVDFLEMGDNQFPDEWPGKPWQSPATMQHSWAYHAKDYNWKPAGQMIRILSQCASLGGNYLLNIGPKFDGSLPVPSTRRLREIGGWMAANGASIQNTKRLGRAPWGWWTQSKDGSIRYAHVHRWPGNQTLSLGKLGAKPAAAAILETNQPLELSEKDGEWSIRVPKNAPDTWDTVVELRMATP